MKCWPLPGKKLNAILICGVLPLIVPISSSTVHIRNSVRPCIWKCINFSNTIYGWWYIYCFILLPYKAGHTVLSILPPKTSYIVVGSNNWWHVKLAMMLGYKHVWYFCVKQLYLLKTTSVRMKQHENNSALLVEVPSCVVFSQYNWSLIGIQIVYLMNMRIDTGFVILWKLSALVMWYDTM